MTKNEDPIIVIQVYNASIQTVWKAITEVEQMRQWYFDNLDAFEAKVGFYTEFNIKVEDRNLPFCISGLIF